MDEFKSTNSLYLGDLTRLCLFDGTHGEFRQYETKRDPDSRGQRSFLETVDISESKIYESSKA